MRREVVGEFTRIGSEVWKEGRSGGETIPNHVIVPICLSLFLLLFLLLFSFIVNACMMHCLYYFIGTRGSA
jgi:hypothetical protein